MKIFKWLFNNIFLFITLFLLIFIPLYPKFPLFGITHTWVYIRLEDFIVAAVLLLWIVVMLVRKISFKTPLTMPIIIFWIVGAISTIHGILLIFPTIESVFPNVAFLSYLRRIEYISLFFVAYSGIKDKRVIPYVVFVLTLTLLLVVGYGIGQKFLGFPAYLTMNEEFAKGIPMRLSQLSRVSSTFAGHYDLAAYLVLIIPLLVSMAFGFRSLFAKFFLLVTAVLGFVLMFMTVSRVSFFVLLLSLIMVLIFQKKKLVILSIISLFLIFAVLLGFSTSLLQRFGNTVKEVDVLVDATSGEAIGHIREVASESFKDRVVMIRRAQSKSEVEATIKSKKEDIEIASKSALIIPNNLLPAQVDLLIEPNSSTGESLPQGTGYINLTLTPVGKRVGQFFYLRSNNQETADLNEVFAVQGDFLIKRAKAYDLSFTTRFQGEWPKAIAIFKKNILFGGGYSATGLAVDNNYFRILGEVGLLGFFSYFAIFLIAGIYIKKTLPEVGSPVVRSFVFGFTAGLLGLALNAILIDVFEASKIAFVFWTLMGITLGTLHLYQKKDIDLFKEVKKALTSSLAVTIYLFIAVIVAFSAISNFYFVGDDFTWLRWAADCSDKIKESDRCQSVITTIFNYFKESNGFFYRPGTKTYFLLMYSGFWLNQTAYHVVSILLHFIVTILIFLISRKILKNFLLSTLSAFLFIIMSGYSEAVFWVSATGHLFNAIFVLLSLYFYIIWKERAKDFFIFLSFVSVVLGLLFYELGVIAPLLIILYAVLYEEKTSLRELFKKRRFLFLFSPLLPYFIIRFLAQSHWFNGDYSYNLFKFFYNAIGNVIGYLMLLLAGPVSLPIYRELRNFSKEHAILVLPVFIAVIFAMLLAYRLFIKKMADNERKIVIFGLMFFIISLLPFLGLGNITSRYSYLSSFGFIIIFTFFIKKVYGYVYGINGRDISVAIIITLISIFSLIHIIQLQKIQRDWSEAGEKVKSFIISLNGHYVDSWTQEHMRFSFVDVPIRVGDAWIFPVGLKDAVWFAFRNDRIDVYQPSSIDEALDLIKDPRTDKVFKFNDSGSVIERRKLQGTAKY